MVKDKDKNLSQTVQTAETEKDWGKVAKVKGDKKRRRPKNDTRGEDEATTSGNPEDGGNVSATQNTKKRPLEEGADGENETSQLRISKAARSFFTGSQTKGSAAPAEEQMETEEGEVAPSKNKGKEKVPGEEIAESDTGEGSQAEQDVEMGEPVAEEPAITAKAANGKTSAAKAAKEKELPPKGNTVATAKPTKEPRLKRLDQLKQPAELSTIRDGIEDEASMTLSFHGPNKLFLLNTDSYFSRREGMGYRMDWTSALDIICGEPDTAKRRDHLHWIQSGIQITMPGPFEMCEQRQNKVLETVRRIWSQIQANSQDFQAMKIRVIGRWLCIRRLPATLEQTLVEARYILNRDLNTAIICRKFQFAHTEAITVQVPDFIRCRDPDYESANKNKLESLKAILSADFTIDNRESQFTCREALDAQGPLTAILELKHLVDDGRPLSLTEYKDTFAEKCLEVFGKRYVLEDGPICDFCTSRYHFSNNCGFENITLDCWTALGSRQKAMMVNGAYPCGSSDYRPRREGGDTGHAGKFVMEKYAAKLAEKSATKTGSLAQVRSTVAVISSSRPSGYRHRESSPEV